MNNNYFDLSKQNSLFLDKIYSTICIGICVLLGTITATQLLISYVCVLINPNIISNGVFYLLLSAFPLYCVALGPYMFFLNKLKAQKPVRKFFRTREYIFSFPIAFFLMIAGAYIGKYADLFAQHIFGVQVSDSLSEVTSHMSLGLKFVFLAVVAPIGEEFIFRKQILDRTAKMSEGASVLFSAAVFALFHGNFNQMFYAFLVGLLLGFIYVRTGNYIFCVVLHAVVNAFFGIIYPYFYELLKNDGTGYALKTFSMGVIVSQWIFALIGLLLIIVYIFAHKIHLEENQFVLARSPYSSAFGNKPFIVLSVIFMAMTLSKYF